MDGQEDFNLGRSDVLDRRFDGYLRDSVHLAQDSILPMKLYCSNKVCKKYLYKNGETSLGSCFLIQELNEDRKCGYLYFVTAAHNLYCTFCENYRWVKPILRWAAGQRQAEDFLLGADNRGVSKSSFYGWMKVSDDYIHGISERQTSKECYPFDYGILAVKIADITQATTYATKMRKLGMFAAPPERHDFVELAYLCGYPGEVCNKSRNVPPQGAPANPDDLQYMGPEPMAGGYSKWKVKGGRFWMSPKRSLPGQTATGTLKPSERREEERRTAALYPLPQRHARDICKKQDSELNKARLYRHYIDSSQGQSGSPVYLCKEEGDDQQCVAVGIHVGLWEDVKGEVKRMGFNVAVRLHGDVLSEMKHWVSDPRNKAKDHCEPDVDIHDGTEEFQMACQPATFFGSNMAPPGAAAHARQDDASAVKDASPASTEHAGVEIASQQDTGGIRDLFNSEDYRVVRMDLIDHMDFSVRISAEGFSLISSEQMDRLCTTVTDRRDHNREMFRMMEAGGPPAIKKFSDKVLGRMGPNFAAYKATLDALLAKQASTQPTAAALSSPRPEEPAPAVVPTGISARSSQSKKGVPSTAALPEERHGNPWRHPRFIETTYSLQMKLTQIVKVRGLCYALQLIGTESYDKLQLLKSKIEHNEKLLSYLKTGDADSFAKFREVMRHLNREVNVFAKILEEWDTIGPFKEDYLDLERKLNDG